MSEEPKIFNTGEKCQAMSSEARGILILLGFHGVWDFSHRCGINHDTCGQLLGTVKAKNKKKHSLLVRCHEALHTAYTDRRAEMSGPMRNYVKDWAKRWRKFAVEEMLWLTSPGRVKEPKDPYQGKSMAKRQAAIKLGVQQALEALKWV